MTTVTVREEIGARAIDMWRALSEPRGASEAEASKVVEGIYRGGIAAARKAAGA